jgi:hypothetical protein
MQLISYHRREEFAAKDLHWDDIVSSSSISAANFLSSRNLHRDGISGSQHTSERHRKVPTKQRS